MGAMTTRGRVREQLTTAVLNGHPVAVRQAHRQWTAADYLLGAPATSVCEPVVITVSAPVGLALEDAVAVVFDWNVTYEELDDDHSVRDVIADAIVNQGCRWIEEARCRLNERVLTGEEATYLAYCRARVAAVFGTRPQPGCAPGEGFAPEVSAWVVR